MKFITVLLTKPSFLSALLMVVLMLAGCNKNNAQSNSTSGSGKNSKGEETKPVIEFRRTPCYGTCPIYKAQIMKDGTIHYQGEKFVEKTGNFTARISAAQVSEIVAEATRLNFWGADSLYTMGATDFPSRVLTIRDNGKIKTVRAETSEPIEIKNLMQFVDETILQALRENALPAKK